MGQAVQIAAEEVRTKLAAMAREVGEPEGSNISVADLFKKKFGMQAGNIVGTGSYKPDYVPAAADTGLSPNITPYCMSGGAGVEVDVDTQTGETRVIKMVNVIDCGRRINPRIVETQISGAALMQLGFTLFEKMHLDAGQVTNASLADYKIPAIMDVPAVMVNDAIDTYQHNGPFGAKGAGESATFALSAAIGNAIDDAVGVRLTELPLTAEAVYRALREKEGRPLQDA
jgi:CO/xanthine dehydrogenase Mo-binding subunit